ncbi:K02A2.6-like [Cordylochernes scorpioides]|uniref:K02A2.6-like n=1 Tax=Cordylochernes scorpioides TaxID=51811 RepID=A0ABY6LUK6_9ARAC|nr:K02A2.6-like [Cordylochernes scorpioides]
MLQWPPILAKVQPHQRVQHKGYVADIMDECIIGLDVLRQFGLSIDIGRNLLRTSDEDIPLLTSQLLHNFQACRVLALEDTQVPPRSECVIKGQLETTKKYRRTDKVPDHLQQVWESSEDYGGTDLTKHRINTGESNPIKRAHNRIPLARRQKVETLVKEMLDQNIIEPSSSLWVSSVVFEKKKGGSTRICVDYMKLNDITKEDSSFSSH